MKRTSIFFLIILFMAVSAPSVTAVDFEEQLKKLGGENAEGYVGPFATAFGTSMNSGLYHTGKVHGLLGFDLGIKMSLVTVSDEDLEYDFFVGDSTMDVSGMGWPVNKLTIDMNQVYPERTTPTVFGKDAGVILEATGAEAALEASLLNADLTQDQINDLKLTPNWATMLAQLDKPIPTVPGIDISTLPLVMPQAAVGLPFNTEVMLRFIPAIDAGDVGEVNFLGLGISHSLSQYIPVPLFPVSITAQYATQKLEVGDLLESNHTSFGVRASMTVGLGFTLTPYLGLGFESSDLKVKYMVENSGNPILDGQEVSLDLDGDNSTRLTAGVRLGLPLITINADYSLGEYSAIAIGLGLTLR